jgi:hypothetical protein
MNPETNQSVIQVVLWAVGIVFILGGIFQSYRQLKKFVDGIGRKQRKQCLVSILMAKTAEEKDKVAIMLLGD